MKKLWKVGLVLIGLVVIALVVVFISLDSIVKKGIERVGPALTKAPVAVQGVSLSPFSGRGEVKGLVVGNPEGFKTESAIRMESVAMALQPSSVLSDKVMVRSVNVIGPEITFEGSLQGNNLSKLLDNVRGTGSKDQPATKEEQKANTRKLQVDEVVISGGKVHVSATMLGGKAATMPLPEIRLAGLGQGPEGITPAELTEKVLQAVLEGSVKSVGGAVGNLGKEVGGTVKDLSTGAVGQAGQVLKGVGDLFKKK